MLVLTCSRSKVHSPTPATTTRNKWATRDDLFSALSTFHIQTELYSDLLNKSLQSHTYHSLYPEDMVLSSIDNNAPLT
jgi:hypothetical protein